MISFILTVLLVATPEPKIDICLSGEEQKLYQLINKYRKSKKLKPIPFSQKLTQVAQAHVRDLTENYDFEQRDRCNPHSWSDQGDWSSCCYTDDHKAAQCMWDKPREIAGYTGDGYEIAYFSTAGASAEQGLDGWKKSPGHNPLLINSGIWKDLEWKGIGVGIYENYGVVWFGLEPDVDRKIVSCN